MSKGQQPVPRLLTAKEESRWSVIHYRERFSASASASLKALNQLGPPLAM